MEKMMRYLLQPRDRLVVKSCSFLSLSSLKTALKKAIQKTAQAAGDSTGKNLLI